jgi:hypothetical protein
VPPAAGEFWRIRPKANEVVLYKWSIHLLSTLPWSIVPFGRIDSSGRGRKRRSFGSPASDGRERPRSRTASALGISRPTVDSHLQALEITQALTLVRPFHGGGQAEIVRQPKAYAFDTGFVSFARGWDPLRPSDRGVLWEHLVVEAFQAQWPDEAVRYWRDKAGREVDFVRPRNRDAVDAYECKWDPGEFDATALKVFREYYPKGDNYLVAPITGPAYAKRAKGLELTVCGLDRLR